MLFFENPPDDHLYLSDA